MTTRPEMRRAVLAAAMLACTGPVAAASGCAPASFEGQAFTVCEADPAKDRLHLFLDDDDGRPLATFRNVDAALAKRGDTLAFAMNGGMYHPDRRPVGLFIRNGVQHAPLVTSAGPGNFGLLPNGVFCIGAAEARVIESRIFAATDPACRDATQSGPMLVIDGALHPRFLPDSSSRFVRNGVGVRADGIVVFAISEQPVTFHAFARLFRDGLGTPNALYLDGKISRLHAPALGRSDPGFPMGPILGVVVAR